MLDVFSIDVLDDIRFHIFPLILLSSYDASRRRWEKQLAYDDVTVN